MMGRDPEEWPISADEKRLESSMGLNPCFQGLRPFFASDGSLLDKNSYKVYEYECVVSRTIISSSEKEE